MRDLTRALEGLSDDLAGTQREIWVLEQIGRELTALADRVGEAGADPLVRRHLDEIARRTAAALARQTSIARMMEECGSERRSANAADAISLLRLARSKPSFSRPAHESPA